MRKTIQRRHDAHVRVHGVCTEHSALFDANPGGQRTRQNLATQVADVDRLLGLQERWIQERLAATRQCELSREALPEAAKLIVNVGKQVHLEEVAMDAMQLPGPRRDEELIAYARGLLDLVSPHGDAFVAGGLPPGFLKNVADEIQRFQTAREAFTTSRQRFTAATRAIRDRLDQSDQAVGFLESLVFHLPDGQPEVLTKLRIAKRVGPRATPTAAEPAPLTLVTPPTPTDKAA